MILGRMALERLAIKVTAGGVIEGILAGVAVEAAKKIYKDSNIDKAGKYTNKVAEYELRRAKGENPTYFKKDLESLSKDLSAAKAATSRLAGLQAALEKAENSGENANVIKKLKEEIKGAKHVVRWTTEQEEPEENAAACPEPSTTKKQMRNKTDNAPQKTEAEKQNEEYRKGLDDWFTEYKKSKMSETEIAEAECDKQIQMFNELLTEEKISFDDFEKYKADAKADLASKINEINESAAAKANELKEKQKADEEAAFEHKQRLIEEEKAKEKELQDYKQQLKETAAVYEEDRLAIQKERMNARYDEQLEKAKENAELLNEIERARAAEIERIENQITQAKLNTASQYTNSAMQVANAAGVIGGASGNKMKGLAITEATINTALAVSKALSSAPWPLSLALAAGAAASGAAQIAKISSQKFAQGGIVNGNSFYGDQVPVMANSGEMILNKEQQKTLLDIAKGKEHDNQPQVNVTFAPNIAPSMNSEDVKKMLRENQSLFIKTRMAA
jgi:hypothetical protein